jgi:rubrerythrin
MTAPEKSTPHASHSTSEEWKDKIVKIFPFIWHSSCYFCRHCEYYFRYNGPQSEPEPNYCPICGVKNER